MTRPRPRLIDGADRLARRSWAVDLIAAIVVAAAARVVMQHGLPGYDSSYALAWGNEFARGDVPDFTVPLAPTPHPLMIVVGAAVSPLGGTGETVMIALHLLAFGALVLGTFRLGQELCSTAVGLVAAGVIGICVPAMELASQGISDVPAVALIVWALLLEIRQRRRGWPVLALLAVAGLLRPETWLLGFVYWLYLLRGSSPRARLGSAVLVIAPPLIWATMDVLSTGNPLWSLTGTRDLADELGRRLALETAPAEIPKFLATLLGPGAPLAAAAGLVVGLKFFRPQTLLLLTAAVLNGLALLAYAAVGLPLNSRYLLLAAVTTALLAGVGAVGWLDNEEVRRRRGYLVASALSAVMLIGGVFAFQSSRLDGARDRLARRDQIRSDRTSLLDAKAVRNLDRRCGPFDLRRQPQRACRRVSHRSPR